MEERPQVRDVKKLADDEGARPAGCIWLAGKIVNCSRVDGLVYHTRADGVATPEVENRPAVAFSAFGGAEKGIKASLLRGGDHKVVQIELIRVVSCREIQRPHERFHRGQLIRRGQPEIGGRSSAAPGERPRKVLLDGARRERLQVAEVAAQSKPTKKSLAQVQKVGRLAEHVRVRKPVNVFQDETTALRKVGGVCACPHPLGIFQAEHS